MQITLNQAELEEAIEDYVRTQININDDQSISIDLKATRGAEGNTATIDIRKGNVKPAKTSKPAYRGNKPGPKPKAVQPEPEAETENETETQNDEVIETTSPEADPDTEAFAKFVSEDNDADEGEAEPEKAAEEKPARTPGSIFSRAG